MSKKNADQLVQDIINGKLSGLDAGSHVEASWEGASEAIQANYEFTEQEFKDALLNSRSQIENAIGTTLTDEQLAAVAGGKGLSTTAKIGIGVSAGAVGAGTIGGAVAGAVAFFVVFK